MDMTNAQWRTSSYTSGNGGNCVEVAGMGAVIAVRDTKDRSRGMLRVSVNEWQRFIGAVNLGELDR